MSTIVQWNTAQEIKTTSDNDERDLELLEGVLKLKHGTKWKGTINKKYMLVELRKEISGSHILIRIGPHPDRSLSGPYADRDICISANGKIFFTEEELNEMNLAVLEAKNVFEHLFREDIEYLKDFKTA